MLKDDKMMSMLTFAVIMIAVGTLLQRVDILGYFSGEGQAALDLRRDEATVRANVLNGIDVLANDLGIREGDAGRLTIVERPECGRVFVRDGQAQYMPAERCVGLQTFKYAISGRSHDQAGEVRVIVRLDEPGQNQAAAGAQRDTPAPAPTRADTGGAAVPAPTPTAPRPQAPAAAGLHDTAPSATPAPAEATAPLPAGGVAVDDAPPGSDVGSGGEALARNGLTRIDPAPMAAGMAAGPTIQSQSDGAGVNVPRSGLPEIGSGGAGPVGLAPSPEMLDGIYALGDATDLAPVDTTPPALLSGPGVTAGAGVSQTRAPQTGQQQPQSPATLAALTESTTPAAPCTVPPVLTLEVRPAGLTDVTIDSTCHAGSVAELSYDGLRFGVALDGAGAGTVTAVGFQQASDAVLRFAGGETMTFNIDFSDTERMARVALVWELPVDLDLNAFEFGALPGGPGHVGPDRPRSHREVRRRGGGYLLEYQPVGGVGQSVSIYTYWHRYGSRSGVVRLGVDFTSRESQQRPDTCGDGALAEPDFMVLRSVAGQLERPRLRRLASLDCAAIAAIAGTADRFIGDAVDDMIVRKR